MIKNNHEATLYMLDWMDYMVERFVWEVLDDSETDPQYSAVTANNTIICYAAAARENGLTVRYGSTEQYFASKHLPEEAYRLFMRKLEREKDYYVGKIWTWDMIKLDE